MKFGKCPLIRSGKILSCRLQAESLIHIVSRIVATRKRLYSRPRNLKAQEASASTAGVVKGSTTSNLLPLPTTLVTLIRP